MIQEYWTIPYIRFVFMSARKTQWARGVAMHSHGPDTFFLCWRKLDETDFHIVVVQAFVVWGGGGVCSSSRPSNKWNKMITEWTRNDKKTEWRLCERRLLRSFHRSRGLGLLYSLLTRKELWKLIDMHTSNYPIE